MHYPAVPTSLCGGRALFLISSSQSNLSFNSIKTLPRSRRRSIISMLLLRLLLEKTIRQDQRLLARSHPVSSPWCHNSFFGRVSLCGCYIYYNVSCKFRRVLWYRALILGGSRTLTDIFPSCLKVSKHMAPGRRSCSKRQSA